MELARGHQTRRWKSRNLNAAVRFKSWCGTLFSSHRDISKRKGPAPPAHMSAAAHMCWTINACWMNE